jgi:hypothetical protein
MFSKVIAACVVATALGQAAVRPLQQSQSATAKSIRQLDQSLKATATEIGDVIDSDAFTKNMKTVDGMVIDYAAVRGELDAAGTGYDRTIANNKNELGRTIATAGDELDLQLENALDEITAALAAMQEDVDTNIMVSQSFLLPWWFFLDGLQFNRRHTPNGDEVYSCVLRDGGSLPCLFNFQHARELKFDYLSPTLPRTGHARRHQD